MDLKNATAVCLIALVSASLVVLIARMLDSQAAAQLEPQLTAIAEELHNIRKQGGMMPKAGETVVDAVDDALVVYYFHSSFRCATCLGIEANTKATLDADFAPQLANEEIVFRPLNFQKPAGKKLAERFKVGDPVVVLARMTGGEVAASKSLDKVRVLVDDKKAFRDYLSGEIKQMLPASKPADAAPKESVPAAKPNKPIPSKSPATIPIPD
jgi:hypothetical protein